MTLTDRIQARLSAPLPSGASLLAGDGPGIPPDVALVPAAVLVPIIDRPEPGLLLTVRTANLRRHAGQIAFPGGRIDAGDAGPVEAALREAEEEVALPRSAVQVVSTIDPYRTVSGFIVTPVISVVTPDIPLVPHAAEVDEIFEVPLAHLFDASNHVRREREWQGSMRSYYEIVWRDFRIWGATAAMIINLSRRLGDMR